MIYVASSWRNEYQPRVVELCKEYGFEVYDFRKDGFSWKDIDENWKEWSIEEYRRKLASDKAELAFERDYNALCISRICILVQPCGPSSHLELGYAEGDLKSTYIYYPNSDVELMKFEPDLMYLMADKIIIGEEELKMLLSTLVHT